MNVYSSFFLAPTDLPLPKKNNGPCPSVLTSAPTRSVHPLQAQQVHPPDQWFRPLSYRLHSIASHASQCHNDSPGHVNMKKDPQKSDDFIGISIITHGEPRNQKGILQSFHLLFIFVWSDITIVVGKLSMLPGLYLCCPFQTGTHRPKKNAKNTHHHVGWNTWLFRVWRSKWWCSKIAFGFGNPD